MWCRTLRRGSGLCVRQEGRHLSDIIFRNWVINVSNQNCIYYRLFWCWHSFFILKINKVTIIWETCVLFASPGINFLYINLQIVFVLPVTFLFVWRRGAYGIVIDLNPLSSLHWAQVQTEKRGVKGSAVGPQGQAVYLATVRIIRGAKFLNSQLANKTGLCQSPSFVLNLGEVRPSLEVQNGLLRGDVLYCIFIVVGSRRLMPPDALQPKAYCTNPGL